MKTTTLTTEEFAAIKAFQTALKSFGPEETLQFFSIACSNVADTKAAYEGDTVLQLKLEAVARDLLTLAGKTDE